MKQFVIIFSSHCFQCCQPQAGSRLTENNIMRQVVTCLPAGRDLTTLEFILSYCNCCSCNTVLALMSVASRYAR